MRLLLLLSLSLTLSTLAPAAIKTGPIYGVVVIPTPDPFPTNGLFAYYGLDELDGIALDAKGTNNLSLLDGTPSSMAGQIATAYRLVNSQSGRSADANMEFSGHDFAIRLWFRPHNTPGLSVIFARVWWQVQSVDTNTITWQVTSGTPQVNVTVTSPAMSLDVWHRIFVWHQTGVEIGVKVDNDAATRQGMVNAMKSAVVGAFTSDVYLEGPYDGSEFGCDEIAIWKDHIPTAAELLTDWNGGAGRTYP